jgi:hypothetical protein
MSQKEGHEDQGEVKGLGGTPQLFQGPQVLLAFFLAHQLREDQEIGQEHQGDVKELEGTSPSHFKVPWSSWPSFWLFPGSMELPPPDIPRK